MELHFWSWPKHVLLSSTHSTLTEAIDHTHRRRANFRTALLLGKAYEETFPKHYSLVANAQ